MKILVITACTADKKFDKLKLPNQLKPADCNTPGLLKLKSQPLKGYETPAAEMYTGNGHLRVKNGVKDLRDPRYPISRDISIDVHIISPAYGLLHEERDYIVPYSYNFSDYPNPVIEQRSKKLKIHPKIECLLPSYDLAFFLLSEPYLTACLLPFDVPKPPVQIFLVEGAEEDIRVNRPHIQAVCIRKKIRKELDAKLPRANNYNRKEAVFERLCTLACNQGLQVFEKVKRNPQRIIEMVLECNGRR